MLDGDRALAALMGPRDGPWQRLLAAGAIAIVVIGALRVASWLWPPDFPGLEVSVFAVEPVSGPDGAVGRAALWGMGATVSERGASATGPWLVLRVIDAADPSEGLRDAILAVAEPGDVLIAEPSLGDRLAADPAVIARGVVLVGGCEPAGTGLAAGQRVRLCEPWTGVDPGGRTLVLEGAPRSLSMPHAFSGAERAAARRGYGAMRLVEAGVARARRMKRPLAASLVEVLLGRPVPEGAAVGEDGP